MISITLHSAALVLFVSLIAETAQTQENLHELRAMWNGGKYSEVLPRLLDYRKQEYGRNVEVDYMIATSACRKLDRDLGYKFFSWILENYMLDETDRAVVQNERQQCDNSNPPNPINSRKLRAVFTPGVTGKGGWVYTDQGVPAMALSSQLSVDPKIPFKERLFEKSDRAKAVVYIRALLQDKLLKGKKDRLSRDLAVHPVGNFVLVSLVGLRPNQLWMLAAWLNDYLLFFNSQYEMPIPRHLITIYMTPWGGIWQNWNPREQYKYVSLTELAEYLHGVKIPATCLGYSSWYDMSIVALVKDLHFGPGTLAHELFHLMVRNNFGDIPPWLDEGMAALYEQAEKIDSSFIAGVPNWRGGLLIDFWEYRPSVEKLIKMKWSSFNDTGWESFKERSVANHAMARYFVLYLQENQKLVEVYNAFKNRKIEDIEQDLGTHSKDLLESILQKSLAEVDKDFDFWFSIEEDWLPVLKIGSKHDFVTKLQTLLKEKGYSVEVNGHFDEDTDHAVRLFQKSYGLDVDGVVGRNTWTALSTYAIK